MKFLAYFLLITAVCLNTLSTFAYVEDKDVIRVGLSNSGFSTFEFDDTTIISTDTASILDMASGTQVKDVPKGTEIRILMRNNEFFAVVNGKELVKNAKGAIVIISNGKLGIKNHNRKGSPAYYKGMIELKAAYPLGKNKFNIVNVLDLQTYLKGVVPNEMPVSFGLSALKAQAVAARNYANRPQNIYKNYDICDSTACQVYYGANSESPLSDKAVDETQGIFALYNKEPILALYSSTGGGITENYEAVYGAGNGFYNSKPYLKSIKDNNNIEKPKTEEELKEFYSNSVPSFDVKSPKYRWKVDFDRFELEETLTKTLREQSLKSLVYPGFGANDEVWGLDDIKVTKRGESGKALEVEIRSMAGNWRVKRELGIRRTFKKGKSLLWSGNFIVEKTMPPVLSEVEKPEKEPAEIKSPKDDENAKNSDGDGDLENKKAEKKEPDVIFAFLKPEKKDSISAVIENFKPGEPKKVYKNGMGLPLPQSFSFIGAGFGHGVGMSQYGAGYLSAQGVGYDEILKHYYSGITLGTMPKKVSYNNYNQNYVQNFYINISDKGTAGALPGNIESNPLKEEIITLYNASKAANKYILNIDNEKKPSEIEFYVNKTRFTPSTKGLYGKIITMDITKYLENGKNTITFVPLKEADKDKTIYFWVEIEK